MKPALQLKFSQQLALTPQLQQAIRLLQLSQLELQLELRQLAERNPMLELDEADSEADAEAEPASAPASESDSGDEGVDSLEWASAGPAEQSIDFSASSHDVAGSRGEAFNEPPEDAVTSSLRDQLLWQLNLSGFSPRDELIACALIDAIDSKGYLASPLADILAALPGSLAVTGDEVEAVRRRLQNFDPLGVASLDLADCLACQLRADPGDDELHRIALSMVLQHMDLLARHDYPRLAKLLDQPLADIHRAAQLIRSLDPQPGARYDSSPVEYVRPDVHVQRDRHGAWQVLLNPAAQPPLRLNSYYCELAAETRGEAGQWMQGQLQEARWLLKSLEARSQTLLKVAAAIVQRQREFLEFGPEAMQPLILREIADEVGMHESTISRVTSQKYMHTPRGLFEFRYFFSSRIHTEMGDSTSSTAIQALLRKLIAAENPEKPLSDQSIAEHFQSHGYQLARRTVAKYRDLLRIPSSSQRQRAG